MTTLDCPLTDLPVGRSMPVHKQRDRRCSRRGEFPEPILDTAMVGFRSYDLRLRLREGRGCFVGGGGAYQETAVTRTWKEARALGRPTRLKPPDGSPREPG